MFRHPIPANDQTDGWVVKTDESKKRRVAFIYSLLYGGFTVVSGSALKADDTRRLVPIWSD